MSADSDVAVLALAGQRFVASIERIGGEDWQRPTPCAEWDVQALVDHVVGGNWFTTLILGGHDADEAMNRTMARFGGGGADGGQASASIVEQQAAFDQPGILDRHAHHVAGELTGRAIIRLRLHDLIAHTWDLDESLGNDSTIPDSLVRWGLDELARADSLTTTFFAGAGTDSALPAAPVSLPGAAAEYLRLLGGRSSTSC